MGELQLVMVTSYERIEVTSRHTVLNIEGGVFSMSRVS